ncbi:MAG: putative secreted protein, partial [Myxococcaceae bacterium]|nr:putative secreted protein [Myxococcaceae bacterium]
AATVVRLDNVFVVRSGTVGDAMTIGSMFLFSYRISKKVPVAPFIRLGLFNHDAGRGGGTALTNPVLGASWALEPLPGLRANLFLAFAFPLGTGGGNTPDPKTAAAAAAGVLARSGMDNAMFAINDLTVFPGVGVSYSRAGFTAQVEATVLQLTRVRGDKVSPDPSRTNFTSGLHLGYFVQPWLSLGAELRYQRFLSTPVAVTKDAALRDNLTFAFGPRFHFKGERFWARPGFSLTVPLDDPMARQRMVVLQLDVPVIFL